MNCRQRKHKWPVNKRTGQRIKRIMHQQLNLFTLSEQQLRFEILEFLKTQGFFIRTELEGECPSCGGDILSYIHILNGRITAICSRCDYFRNLGRICGAIEIPEASSMEDMEWWKD